MQCDTMQPRERLKYFEKLDHKTLTIDQVNLTNGFLPSQNIHQKVLYTLHSHVRSVCIEIPCTCYSRTENTCLTISFCLPIIFILKKKKVLKLVLRESYVNYYLHQVRGLKNILFSYSNLFIHFFFFLSDKN